MAKFVVIEELHVTVRVPDDLSDVHDKEVRKRLTSRPFRSRLLAAVKQVVAGFPALAVAKVHVAR